MVSIRYPADLPISIRRDEILATLRAHQVVVIAGETGSGKTTQLPKMCLELGLDQKGMIGCTQPRRVAARSVSRRVAEELGAVWGREVGCKMRFNDDTSRDTRLKFMTDGILLAEVQSDPMLRAYSALIVDEAHERSLNIDFLLGHLKGLLTRRPDLKLVITSATIDTQAFSKAFNDAPIVEVSGRLYPVEIRYAPVESFGSEDDDALDYIEASAHVVEDALLESAEGDILVFMPTERDIREARDLLEGRLGSGIEVLALFGRQAAAEQQRIFSPGAKRRVIVATNVAETSLTLPRIRYVVDTGLARMSRYNPRTRTKRLPVEPVAQSSANQRAGRAGRLQAGVCIRLYTQEDFEKRPLFSQPEIQRANLAEVVLRMKAFRLGAIETFPFINPPLPAAIKAGYDLLHELGALKDTLDELTPTGQKLARLPIDPTLGRMLLRAREEKVLPEMLVIAAGLSVPDPRERPEEAREQAAQAHKAFHCPDSDFLSLLRIWRAAPDTESNASRNALRRFCKSRFLSLTRMREWREIYRQLAETMLEEGESIDMTVAEREGTDDAVHRCVLSGLLGHIAMRQERNLFKASGNRMATLFPGSNLYERREKNSGRRPPEEGKPVAQKSNQPAWIVAGEIVQTSQLFARNVARIQPEWIIDVGAHLCRYQYSEPHWSQKAGRVLTWERALLNGLEVRRRTIDFGKVDAKAATEMFIRAVLLDRESTVVTHRFFTDNWKLRDKLETVLVRARSHRSYDLEDALFRFYATRLQGISSVHDLNRVVMAGLKDNPDFLRASEEDFTAGDDFSSDLALFPDHVEVGNTVLPLSYIYTPGEEKDGVTIQVPLTAAEHLTPAQVQWMIPGMREEQISVLLQALPRRLRRDLMPLEPKARLAAREFDPGRGEFMPALCAYLSRKYAVTLTPEDWPEQRLPDYLQPRVEIIDRKQQTVAEGRDVRQILAKVEQRRDTRSDAWEKAVQRFEKPAVTGWTFGDLPESIHIEEVCGVMQKGYPGLALRDKEVDVRLFRKPEEAAWATPAGIQRLAEKALAKDLAWLWKEFRNLAPVTAQNRSSANFHDALHSLGNRMAGPAAPVGQAFTSAERLQDNACTHLARHLFRLEPLHPITQKRFDAMLESARKELPALAHRVRTMVQLICELYTKLKASKLRYPGFDADLARLLPADFLARTPHAQLTHFPRYLKAIQVRADRAAVNPAKDEEKAWQLEEFDHWEELVPLPKREAFRWMLEELRVSIFATELGTAHPVSAKRLWSTAGVERE